MSSPFEWQGKPSVFTSRLNVRDFGTASLARLANLKSPAAKNHIRLPGSAPYIRLDGSNGAEFAHVQQPEHRDFER